MHNIPNSIIFMKRSTGFFSWYKWFIVLLFYLLKYVILIISFNLYKNVESEPTLKIK